MDPTAPLWMQARAVAATLGSLVNGTTQKTTLGYYVSDQFWRWRELSITYTLPQQFLHMVRGGPARRSCSARATCTCGRSSRVSIPSRTTA